MNKLSNFISNFQKFLKLAFMINSKEGLGHSHSLLSFQPPFGNFIVKYDSFQGLVFDLLNYDKVILGNTRGSPS